MDTRRPQVFFTRAMCLALLSLLSISCATRSGSEVADWNSHKIWQQVASNPPTYVPTGYAASQPRTDHDGTWFTDKRDGKRLFVPKNGVRGLEPGVLTGEAKKVTGSDGKPRLSTGQKAWWGVLALLAAMGRTELPPPD
ncbi:hypothetical protein [Prosthecobacter sp.]|jgi:hypothetical protein|uniref:hypothetical protein n=1 Tax=Prosthecobacter sp. TaxID=1965333 RepID=UPI0037842800